MMAHENLQQNANLPPTISTVEQNKNLRNVIHFKLSRLTTAGLFLSSSLFASIAIEMASSSSSYADSLGYPYPGDTEAPCEFGQAGGPSCTNPNNPYDKYDWGVYDSSGKFHPYREAGGYEYRNCTDYVAWKLESKGLSSSKVNGLGNGGDWYNNAPSSEQMAMPEAWDAAVVPATYDSKGNETNPGHVAFVESVNSIDPNNSGNDNITVSEYNKDGEGDGGQRTGTASSMGFTEFVDFGVHPTNNSGSQILSKRNNDYNKDNKDDVALRRSNTFYFDTYHDGNEAELSFTYGAVGSSIYIGDFNGDHADDVATRNGNIFYEDTGDNGGMAERSFSFGLANDEVYIGDFDGNGTDDVAIRRGNTFYEDTGDNGGAAERSFSFGQSGDDVYVGDFNGDKKDDIVLRRGNMFYEDTGDNGGAPEKSFSFGLATDEVYTGDFNADGLDDIALRRSNTFFFDLNHSGGYAEDSYSFGQVGTEVCVGDWDGNGTSDVAVYNGNNFYFNTAHTGGTTTNSYSFGTASDEVICAK